MPLDAGPRRMLKVLDALGRPSLAGGTPEDARRGFRDIAVERRKPETVVPVGEVADIVVDGAAGLCAARVYRPAGVTAPLPTVAFFHGGGFVIGDLDTHDNQCRWLCAEVRAVVVSVDYRLAPEHPFPAALDDCEAAMRWVIAHVGELGGDPQRIGVAGDSAGANLATGVARRCRDAGGPVPTAQLLVYPFVDLRDGQRWDSRQRYAQGYFLTADDVRWFGACYAGTADPSTPELSPLLADLVGLPPAVVVTAELDPLRDEGKAYGRALADAGVPVVHEQFPGMIHGFLDMAPLSPGCEAAVRATCAAFADLLG